MGGGHKREQRQIMFPVHAHMGTSGQVLCPNNCSTGRVEESLFYLQHIYIHIKNKMYHIYSQI